MKAALDRYFRQEMEQYELALRSIDTDVFERLIDDCRQTLEAGHKVIASGLGKNVPICEKFEGTMLSLGLDANFLHTNSAVHGDMGMVKSGDLVLILTKSGSTQESVYLVDLLQKRPGVKLWLLSFQPHSPLADTMKNTLIMRLDHEGDLWNILPNNSTVIYLIVLQKIAIELSARMHLSLETDFKPNHPGGAIGGLLREK